MSLSDPRDEDEYIPLDAIRTPLEIDNQIQWALYYQRKATYVINELRIEFTKAKDAYTKASKTFQISLVGQGSKEDRENRAQIEHWDLYEKMVDAQLLLEHAREKREDIKSTLSAAQTEVKLIVAEIQLSGRIGA